MESLPFDAAEKLLEIEVRRGSGSLRDLGPDTWSAVVRAGGGDILQSSSGEEVDAHVLSESSLFVWERSASLLTCGRTDLGRAFEALVQVVGAEALAGVRLSRERDRFPGSVKTRFEDDVVRLAGAIDGETLESRRGDAALRSFEGGRLEAGLRFRVFCRGLGEEARRVFLGAVDEAPPLLGGIGAHFAGDLVQRHRFEPAGYSLNAVRGADALCLHVSPEASADVASLETSTLDVALQLALLEEVERAFRPARITLTLDGKNLMGAREAKELLAGQPRSDDARVL